MVDRVTVTIRVEQLAAQSGYGAALPNPARSAESKFAGGTEPVYRWADVPVEGTAVAQWRSGTA